MLIALFSVPDGLSEDEEGEEEQEEEPPAGPQRHKRHPSTESHHSHTSSHDSNNSRGGKSDSVRPAQAAPRRVSTNHDRRCSSNVDLEDLSPTN